MDRYYWRSRAFAPALLAAAVLAASSAQSATLYKLVDRAGKVSYVASPPPAFDGKVVPVEIDSSGGKGIMPAREAPEPSQGDYLSERRARWAAVEKRLKDARAWLEEAKENFAKAEAGDGDLIWVAKQTPPSKPEKPKPHESPMVNGDTRMCGQVMRNGQRMQACARPAVSDGFAARLEQLQEQIHQAEQAVAEAEIAYRRGMD